MHFQKTTEYAIRVMVYLAAHKPERFSTNRLHRELKIPYKYLGRLMSKLSTAGFVEASSGKTGGYQIVKELKDIYLYQIMDLVEGLDDFVRCVLGFETCSDKNPCSLHQLWTDRREDLKKLMYHTSLADLGHEMIKQY